MMGGNSVSCCGCYEPEKLGSVEEGYEQVGLVRLDKYVGQLAILHEEYFEDVEYIEGLSNKTSCT
jgi:hypothetical protein